jgi:hypothetical protein
MTVDFRSVVLTKGDDTEPVHGTLAARRSPTAYLLAVVLAVVSGLCAVAWILG